MREVRITGRVGFQAAAALLVVLFSSACVSGTAAIRVDPETAAEAQRQPVVLDEMATDAVRAIDVVNRSKANVSRSGEIYLMRGLANVFSRGIDEMARELRSRGYDAANFSYTEWRPVAEDIIRRNASKKVSYPVVIVGHSLGGNESSKFANRLASGGVNVALVVAFDPVEPGQVGPGIAQVINYYLPKQNTDNRIMPAGGFTGKLDNVDVTTNAQITHTNVDKQPNFQSAVYTSIANITGKLRANQARRAEPGR